MSDFERATREGLEAKVRQLEARLSAVNAMCAAAETRLREVEEENERLKESLDYTPVALQSALDSMKDLQSRLSTAEAELRNWKSGLHRADPDNKLIDQLNARLSAAEEWKPMYEAQQRQLGRAEAVVETAKLSARKLPFTDPLHEAIRQYEEDR